MYQFMPSAHLYKYYSPQIKNPTLIMFPKKLGLLIWDVPEKKVGLLVWEGAILIFEERNKNAWLWAVRKILLPPSQIKNPFFISQSTLLLQILTPQLCIFWSILPTNACILNGNLSHFSKYKSRTYLMG